MKWDKMGAGKGGEEGVRGYRRKEREGGKKEEGEGMPGNPVSECMTASPTWTCVSSKLTKPNISPPYPILLQTRITPKTGMIKAFLRYFIKARFFSVLSTIFSSPNGFRERDLSPISDENPATVDSSVCVCFQLSSFDTKFGPFRMQTRSFVNICTKSCILNIIYFSPRRMCLSISK